MKQKYIILGLFVFLLIGFVLLTMREAPTENSVSSDMMKEQKLFEIASGRLDCETVRIFIYHDNHYKYIYGYLDDEQKYKEGTYNYSTERLMETLRETSIPDNLGPYYLWDSEEIKYTVYETNQELKLFLESIPVPLDTCMER